MSLFAARFCVVLGALLLAVGCATEPVRTSFDSSAGQASCEILGDGFVLTNGRHIPLEAFVLELRQATRAMTREELLRYVVALRISPDIADGAAAKVATDGREYLMLQLEIMGVRQAGM